MLGSRKSQRTFGGEEMKKKNLLNAIIILLLIIMGASILIAAFMVNKFVGFIAIGLMCLLYAIMLMEEINND